METPDEFLVMRLLEDLPVRPTKSLTIRDFHIALSEICRLFDIGTEVHEDGGMSYGPDGLNTVDQPLYWAIRALAEKRFAPHA